MTRTHFMKNRNLKEKDLLTKKELWNSKRGILVVVRIFQAIRSPKGFGKLFKNDPYTHLPGEQSVPVRSGCTTDTGLAYCAFQMIAICQRNKQLSLAKVVYCCLGLGSAGGRAQHLSTIFLQYYRCVCPAQFCRHYHFFSFLIIVNNS